MSTVIDELVTILGLDVDEGVGQTIQKFNAGLDGITRFAGWAGAALMTAAGTIAYFTEQSAQAAAELDKFNQLTNISTDTLQGMMFATEQAGGSADALKSDLMSLTKSMSSPIPGEFNHALFMMGINTKKANGELKSADEVLMDVADKMEGMSNIEQLQWGSKIGLSGDTILMLQQGRTEIERLQKQAESIPVIVGADSLKNAREFVAQLQMVRRIFTYIGQEASSAAGPALKGIVEDFTEWLKLNREFIQQGIQNFIGGIVDGFTRFFEILKNGKQWLAELLPGLGKFTTALTSVEVISAVVMSILTAMGVAFVIIAGQYALVAAGVLAAALVFEDFVTYLRGGESAIGELLKIIDKMYDKFKTRFPAIAEFLEGFAAILKGGVLVAISAVSNAFKLLWQGLKMMGGGLAWILDKIETGLSKIGWGGGGTAKGLTDFMDELAEKADKFGDELTIKAEDFNANAQHTVLNPQAPSLYSPHEQGKAQANQEVTINQNFNIQGSNATGIASETARATKDSYNRLFPGGLIPVVN